MLLLVFGKSINIQVGLYIGGDRTIITLLRRKSMVSKCDAPNPF